MIRDANLSNYLIKIKTLKSFSLTTIFVELNLSQKSVLLMKCGRLKRSQVLWCTKIRPISPPFHLGSPVMLWPIQWDRNDNLPLLRWMAVPVLAFWSCHINLTTNSWSHLQVTLKMQEQEEAIKKGRKLSGPSSISYGLEESPPQALLEFLTHRLVRCKFWGSLLHSYN